ncbi:MAG: GspE/PulE family protein [Rhodothermales bacterium]|nr:GspE/PulE family protein [Rhodothermales bacterium]
MYEKDIALPPADLDVFDPINLDDRVVIKLLFDQVVRIEQIEAAWYRWRERQQKGHADELWRVLAEDDDLDRDKVFAEAATIYAFKPCTIPRQKILAFIQRSRDQFEKEQWEAFARLKILPVAASPGGGGPTHWIFATHDPVRSEINQYLRSIHLKRFDVLYAAESVIDGVIQEAILSKNEYLERINDEGIAFDLGLNIEEKDNEMIDEDALVAEINRSKLINLFEAMLVEAVRRGTSDIHLFPNGRREIEIHFRVDGDLDLWHVEDRVHPEAFLAVVKDNVMNVDRFERDTAQDGFIQRTIDGTIIRFRVSILPLATAAANLRSESIVIRVLDDRKVILDLKKIGLQKTAYDRFQHAIRQPYGMVILTGPTGSGKTTTLYASLHQVVSPKRNVLTVEDPVEYILPGVRQIKLSHKLDLEGALRSILRHDPDIVMVGEMRDRQTAELAIKLANTGHLTFSTLHTNDAPSAVSRLYKMGIEPFLIAYAINLVVAQRLIRKICPQCRQEIEQKDEALLKRLGFTAEEIATVTFYKGGHDPDCDTCRGQGYKGRRAITETLLFTPEIRQQVVSAKGEINEDDIRNLALSQGMMTLQDSAREIVKEGETSVEEMLRVVFTD